MTQDRPPFFSLTAALIGAVTGLATGAFGTAVLLGLTADGLVGPAILVGVPFGIGLAVLAISFWKMRPLLTGLFPVLTPLIYFAAIFVAIAVENGDMFLPGLLGGTVGGLGVGAMAAVVFPPARSAAFILVITGLGAAAGAGLLPLMDVVPGDDGFTLHMGWHAVVLGTLNGLLSGKARA